MMDIKEESILPLTNVSGNGAKNSPPFYESPVRGGLGYSNGYALNLNQGLQVNGDEKKSDERDGVGRKRGNSNASWLPPGTRQQETWRPREVGVGGLSMAPNISVS